MTALNPRPIIFPLSNPVRLSECEFAEAVEWSGGRVVFASGSPFPQMTYNDREMHPGQGNNMYIFPGMTLFSFLMKYIHTQGLGYSNHRPWPGCYPGAGFLRDGQNG